jgi:hypothetical protein
MRTRSITVAIPVEVYLAAFKEAKKFHRTISEQLRIFYQERQLSPLPESMVEI